MAIILFSESKTSENIAGDLQHSDIGSHQFLGHRKVLIALGAEKFEGRGSRVAFVMPNRKKWEHHRPHPGKEARKYQVESVS